VLIEEQRQACSGNMLRRLRCPEPYTRDDASLQSQQELMLKRRIRLFGLRSRLHWIIAPLTLACALSLVSLASSASGPLSDPQLATLRIDVEKSTSQPQHVKALWTLADALSDRGLLLEAERTLREAETLSRDAAQTRGTALRLGAVLVAGGKVDAAREELKLVESPSEALSPTEQLFLRQTEGNLAVRTGDLVLAEQDFEAEEADSRSLGLTSAEARARINALRARLDRQEVAELEERLQSLDTFTSALPSGEETATIRLAVGELTERAVREFRSPVALRERVYSAYTGVQAESTNAATRAYAAGLLGALYEDEGRIEEALRLTMQAVSLSQSIDAPEQLYRWEWQAARLERASARPADSEQAIDRALFALAGIRSDVLQSSRRAFATRIEPVYLDYADAHLREAAALSEGSPEQQRVLRDVRDQLESLKQAEVQDYFDNGCVTSNVANSAGMNIPGAAVIYPILLTDRLEVLIETGGTLRRFSAPVSRGEITATIRRLRLGIERPSAGDAYQEPAQRLYQWLLADAAAWLASQKVDTLVFVPSGPLRTIPLGVLHDGKRFLIERFSVATTPAITLIPTLVTPATNRVLVAGLTQSVQGFAGLPAVGEEIKEIGAMFPGQSLKDQNGPVHAGLLGGPFSHAWAVQCRSPPVLHPHLRQSPHDGRTAERARQAAGSAGSSGLKCL
jgi:hypothetical protein